jgi:hypothetical protein
MLIPQRQRDAAEGQGCPDVSLAEVRRHLADPSQMQDRARQRLRTLERRLARLQTAGDEYARVSLSHWAEAALEAAPQT